MAAPPLVVPPALNGHRRPPAPHAPPTLADYGKWSAYATRLSLCLGNGASGEEVGQVYRFVYELGLRLPGGYPWAAVLAPVIHAAVATATAPQNNRFARALNSAVMLQRGKRLEPLQNAAGQTPPPNLFPDDTTVLLTWEQTHLRDPITWDRLHRLLDHYQILDPSTNALFAPPLPPCPAADAVAVAELQRRVLIFKEFIQM